MSSCLRFTAERSFALSGLPSGSTKMRSRHSISAIVCSASIRHNIQQKGGEVNSERPPAPAALMPQPKPRKESAPLLCILVVLIPESCDQHCFLAGNSHQEH
jgi:hypothetical protein